MEEERRTWSTAPRTAIAVVWPFWFLAVLFLGLVGAFVRPERQTQIPILLVATVPLGAFLLALVFWPSFRLTVLASDPRVLTAMQAWRAAGLGFIALYAHGLLPGVFAWPAGLGDIAVGLTAPWIVAALI